MFGFRYFDDHIVEELMHIRAVFQQLAAHKILWMDPNDIVETRRKKKAWILVYVHIVFPHTLGKSKSSSGQVDSISKSKAVTDWLFFCESWWRHLFSVFPASQHLFQPEKWAPIKFVPSPFSPRSLPPPLFSVAPTKGLSPFPTRSMWNFQLLSISRWRKGQCHVSWAETQEHVAGKGI